MPEFNQKYMPLIRFWIKQATMGQNARPDYIAALNVQVQQPDATENAHVNKSSGDSSSTN